MKRRRGQNGLPYHVWALAEGQMISMLSYQDMFRPLDFWVHCWVSSSGSANTLSICTCHSHSFVRKFGVLEAKLSQPQQDLPFLLETLCYVYASSACVCVFVSVCVSMYLCIYASMHVCVYVSMYLCVYASMYPCIYVSMYLCKYVLPLDCRFHCLLCIIKGKSI